MIAEDKKIIASTTAQLLHQALKYAAKNDIRYYLHGVHLFRSGSGGLVVAATNGHMAALFNDANGTYEHDQRIVVVRHDIVMRLPKSGKVFIDEDGMISCTCSKTSQNITMQNALMEVGEVKLPDYAKIVPSGDDLVAGMTTAMINNEYLEEALKLFPASRGGSRGISAFQRAGGTGALLLTDCYQQVIVIIMPMRRTTEPPVFGWMPDPVRPVTTNKESN